MVFGFLMVRTISLECLIYSMTLKNSCYLPPTRQSGKLDTSGEKIETALGLKLLKNQSPNCEKCQNFGEKLFSFRENLLTNLEQSLNQDGFEVSRRHGSEMS